VGYDHTTLRPALDGHRITDFIRAAPKLHSVLPGSGTLLHPVSCFSSESASMTPQELIAALQAAAARGDTKAAWVLRMVLQTVKRLH